MSLKNFLLVVTLALFGAASAQTFASDPAHTFALFRANHAGVSYAFGAFDELTATLEYDEEAIENSSLEFSILTESVDSGKDLEDVEFDGARRDGHLISPDFFDAAQFPTIDFVSTSIAPTDEENVFEVTGDLTMHGVTNEVTTSVERIGSSQNQQGQATIGFYTEFMIDRTDYGMNNLLEAAGPEILLMVGFEGVAQ